MHWLNGWVKVSEAHTRAHTHYLNESPSPEALGLYNDGLGLNGAHARTDKQRRQESDREASEIARHTSHAGPKINVLR